jgi:serine/threonine-protein kinase
MAVDLLHDRLQRAVGDRYTIIRELGRGGMAIVYLAQDLRNDRRVAGKVLSPALASAIGAGRFAREIEIAARLVHPHIVPLFDSGDADGLLFYVMPLIEGESLRIRLAREGALPVEEAVGIAREVGAALTFAHQHGFVHRDVKPENILLHGAMAYLADFGIALALQGVDQERLTNTGLSLGTPAYMSPEQASGDKRLDERSDVYSLGSVVYEMLAGDPAFDGSARVVVARILTENPVRLGAIRPTLPDAVSDVVARAMAKMPADRYRTAEDFVTALEHARTQPRQPPHLRAPPSGRRPGFGLAVAAGLATLLTLVLLLPRRSAPVPAAPMVERQLTTSGDAWAASPSPDGRKVAYYANHATALVLRDVDTGDSTVLVRNPAGFTVAHGIHWNHDGSRILYHGTHPVGYAYYSISARGGRPSEVALTNGELYYGPDDSTFLSTMEAAVYVGHAPTTFQIVGDDSVVGDGTVINLKKDFSFIYQSRLSPDGRWIAALVQGRSGEVMLIALRHDGAYKVLVSDIGTPSSPVDRSNYSLSWSVDGKSLYYPRPQGLGWSIWRVGVDPRTGQASAAPTVIAERLPPSLSFGVSPAGRLVYSGGAAEVQLTRVRFDARGRAESTLRLTTGTSMRTGPAISPDGSEVVYRRQAQDGRADVFMVSIDGGQERRLTSSGAPKSAPAWSPDARAVAFVEQHKPGAALMITDVASGRTTRLGRGPGDAVGNGLPPVWSRDGRTILYPAAGFRSYLVVDRITGRERPLVSNESIGWMFNPVFSPGATSVVVMWHRPPSTRLWLIELEDGRQRELPVKGPAGPPMLWPRDSLVYYEGEYHRGDTTEGVTEIMRADLHTGQSNTFARMPVPCTEGMALSRDERTLVCGIATVTSDVWMAESAPPR